MRSHTRPLSRLSKCKKTEFISIIYFNHSAVRLEINYKIKNWYKKNHKHTEAKQYTTKQLMDPWRNQKRNQMIPRDKWQPKYDNSKPTGWSKSSSQSEVYGNTILPQDTRKTSKKQSNLTPKATRERNKWSPKLIEGKKDQSCNKSMRRRKNGKDQWN